MKLAAIVLSRFNSSRLPGKAMQSIGGQTLLSRVLQAVSELQNIDAACLATSDHVDDDVLAKCAEEHGVSVFRGPEDNVLLRLLGAARWLGVNAVLRVNGDSPFLRPRLLDAFIEIYRQFEPDMLTNAREKTMPEGHTIEIVSTQVLERALLTKEHELHREHITTYFYDHASEFDIIQISCNTMRHRRSKLAIDLPIDREKACQVYERIGPVRVHEMTLSEIMDEMIRSAPQDE